MTKRIFRSILSVSVSVLVLCFAVILGVLYGFFSIERREQLRTELAIAAHGMETGGKSWLESLSAGDHRFTLISSDGIVLFDSEAETASMDNHLNREEIQEALANGRGESERTSATLTEKTMYQALRLNNGNVLRISITRDSVFALLLDMLIPICIVLAAAIILAAVLANRISKRTVAPLNALDLEHPLDNEAYDELSPFLLRIAHQQRQIDFQIAELKKKQDELLSVTQSMNEGLILLNDKGLIVSINPAAQRLFGTHSSCIGQDLMIVERDRGVRLALDKAIMDGHGTASILRSGRQYAVNISRIISGGKAVGTAILTFDTTETVIAEQQRREFTANVSHELKTPLQSIMGSAELIENGLVKPGDMLRFIANIRTEAARLVTLIEDIIRLSQLDEGCELPREEMDLSKIINEVVAALHDMATSKRIHLTVRCDPSTILWGVRGLLYELIYNLCDNAVKYNVEGGAVDISVSSSENEVVLTVADTGIGIPIEHQSRVFERFYRVDKSHSKSTGGTGLGLSIVKHAVLAHNGEIRLESIVEKGTRISVTLPR